MVDGRRAVSRNRIADIYENIRWCWVAFALASVILQATRTVDISPMHDEILDKGELALTILFDVEIVIRVLAYLPDWRKFFYRGQNVLDLFLAIGSSIIQVPAIHESKVYPWLTILQLMRFYRVILEIPRMKPLLVSPQRVTQGLPALTSASVVARCIRQYVRSGQHVSVPDRDQPTRGSIRSSAGERRCQSRRSHRFRNTVQHLPCHLSSLLIRKLDGRALHRGCAGGASKAVSCCGSVCSRVDVLREL